MTEYIERDAALNLVCTTTMDNVADAPMFLRLIKGLPAAAVEPVVHEPCEFCGGEKTEYSDSAYGKFSILKDRLVGWCIAAEFSQCPPFADCAVKNMKLTHLRQIKHCPNCGRKLDMDERSDA